ncbi:hypothetical protein AB0I84_06110 [Streptomyces spectabilis]|uniref:hypothetical protein n=1 Tax=Streptomyces spectabilis TaxID=68270 RepID=UPI0033DB8026
MRTRPGPWRTRQGLAVQEAAGFGCNRWTVRQDFKALAASGHALEHGPGNDRSYSLNYAREHRHAPHRIAPDAPAAHPGLGLARRSGR